MYLGNVNRGFSSESAHNAMYFRGIPNGRVPPDGPEVPPRRIYRTRSDPALYPQAESRFGPPTSEMTLFISKPPLQRTKSLPPQPRNRRPSPTRKRHHQRELLEPAYPRRNGVFPTRHGTRLNDNPVLTNPYLRRSFSRNEKHRFSRKNIKRKSMPPIVGAFRSKKFSLHTRNQNISSNIINTPREDYPLSATVPTNGNIGTTPLSLYSPPVASETRRGPHGIANGTVVEPHKDYPLYATRIDTHPPANVTDSTLKYSFLTVSTEAGLPTRYQDYHGLHGLPHEHNGTGWAPEPDYTRTKGRGRDELPIGRTDLNSAGRRSSRGSHSKKKMTTGCHQFLRYATTLFTFIVFIAGAGILGLGIYLIGSDYGATQLSSVLGNDLYKISAYFLIAAGGVLVLISMCGCCGALRESKFLLGCFIFAISILVLALVAAAVIVFVFRQKMEGDIIHSMRDVLVEKYGVELGNHQDNRMVTNMWNWLQRELKCCGVTGTANSTQSWKIYQHTVWYKGFDTGKPYVPESCCKPDGDINICTGITPINGPPSVGPPITADMQINENLYTVGCYDELVHYIQNHAVIIGVCSIATVVIMLFGLLFSAYLCRRIDVEEYMY